MTEQEMLNLVAKVKWRYSVRYKSSPHEYHLLSDCPELEDQFRDFARQIKKQGVIETYLSKNYICFYLGEYKYWLMSDPEKLILINRTFADDDRRKKIIPYILSENFKIVYRMSLKDIEDQMSNK